jgi:hypothetical protein
MTVAEDLQSADGYTVYRPTGKCALGKVAAMVTESIKLCCQRRAKRLLIDLTALSGFSPPTTLQRYEIDSAWTHAAKDIKIAFLFRPEVLDPQRFGMTVARNRGMHGDVFLAEMEALAWLTASPPSPAGPAGGWAADRLWWI